MFLLHKGVTKNIKSSTEWFEKAAAGGDDMGRRSLKASNVGLNDFKINYFSLPLRLQIIEGHIRRDGRVVECAGLLN